MHLQTNLCYVMYAVFCTVAIMYYPQFFSSSIERNPFPKASMVSQYHLSL